MDILIKAAQLILSLSIIVILHELGHFIPARWFKIRVEKFYLFFDPWFSLFKVNKGGTEYGIGWLPVGGYVKISGMVDESMDKEQMAKPPEPWEFRSKPAWQRLIVMVGGVTVNLILGMLIYTMVLFVWGRDFLPLSEVKYGIHPSEVMKAEGVQEGDRLLKLDGRTPRTLEELTKDILLTDAHTLTVERNGTEQEVKLSPDVSDKILNSGEKELFGIRIPFIVDTVMVGDNAEAAGVKKNDVMLAVNSTDTKFFGDFRKALAEHKGAEVTLKVQRDGAPIAITVKVSEEGTIGIGNRSPDTYFNYGHETFSFGESIPAGISLAMNTLTGYVSSLKLLFSKAGASQIGGFGSIGSMFPSTWNWQAFWSLTALLSIILAFMNLLPIPALDGGHVMFLLYEMVVGKPAPQRVMEVAQMVGMVLLLGLMLFANGNDLFKGLNN